MTVSSTTTRSLAREHAVRDVLILALAPAIGLGIGRFGYSLVLPDMRDSLGWSYSTAGFMNTINAVGYLVGALWAAAIIRRIGLSRTVVGGALIALASLMMCAISGQVVVFSIARLLAGFGAALSFVGGGTMAATIAQAQRSRSSLVLALFYTGPGLGIVLSGLTAPFLLDYLGPGSWRAVWVALAIICAVMTIPLLSARSEATASSASDAAVRVPLRPIAIYLVAYFLFGAGYIAYMTFMIAYVRDGGGGAAAQSLFWSLIGLSAFVSPWIWQRLLARGQSGMAMAILLGVTAFGAGLALLGHSPWLLTISALVFGNAFFSVVTSTTAFCRFNYPPEAWPKAIAVMTITFGLGQTLGPLVTGAITDALGTLSSALIASAAMLLAGALLAALQRPVRAAVDDS